MTRSEFYSYERQIYANSKFCTFPKRNDPKDIFYEDHGIDHERAKRLQMKRRDLFFMDYDETQGHYGIFNLLHNRASYRSLCLSYPPAGYNTLQCTNKECIESGPCLTSSALVHFHNVNR